MKGLVQALVIHNKKPHRSCVRGVSRELPVDVQARPVGRKGHQLPDPSGHKAPPLVPELHASAYNRSRTQHAWPTVHLTCVVCTVFTHQTFGGYTHIYSHQSNRAVIKHH